MAETAPFTLIKALSITRPWPELIFRGKTVENRTWNTTYRGEFLIHAAQSWAVEAICFAADVAPRAIIGVPASRTEHPTGIVGVAELTGVCRNEMDEPDEDETWAPCRCIPWAMPAQFHWRLANVRRFTKPVPCKGALGWWSPSPEVMAAVRVQLDALAVLDPEVTVTPTTYTISLLPETNRNYDSCAVTVEYRGDDQWAVLEGHWCLGVDGEWDYEPILSERTDGWLAAHTFPLDEALRLAKEAAPGISVNGWTAERILAEGHGAR